MLPLTPDEEAAHYDPFYQAMGVKARHPVRRPRKKPRRRRQKTIEVGGRSMLVEWDE